MANEYGEFVKYLQSLLTPQGETANIAQSTNPMAILMMNPMMISANGYTLHRLYGQYMENKKCRKRLFMNTTSCLRNQRVSGLQKSKHRACYETF